MHRCARRSSSASASKKRHVAHGRPERVESGVRQGLIRQGARISATLFGSNEVQSARNATGSPYAVGILSADALAGDLTLPSEKPATIRPRKQERRNTTNVSVRQDVWRHSRPRDGDFISAVQTTGILYLRYYRLTARIAVIRQTYPIRQDDWRRSRPRDGDFIYQAPTSA